MFPLTRQSFVLFTATLVFVLNGWNDGARLFAQPPAGGAPPAAAAWTQPPWYMDEVKAKAFSRKKINIVPLLKQNSLNTAQSAQLKLVAHYYLSRMMHKELRQRLPKEVTQRMLAEILTPSNRPSSRAVLMDEVIDKVPSLLNHPSDVVRLNAVLLLSQLSIEPANFQKKTPALPYAPVHKILITILTDQPQITSCKIAAAAGLGRICRDDKNNSLSSKSRSDIAIALVSVLSATPPSNKAGDLWLRYRIVDTLGYVGRLDNVSGQPIVIDTLIEILGNSKEHLNVRTQAALSISRLPYSSSTNVKLITHEVCELLLRLTAEIKKNPKGTHWREYYSRIYLSFRPMTQAQANKNWGLLYQVKRGNLGANTGYVQDAFKRVMPILKPVLEQATPGLVPAESQKTLLDWVLEKKPTNRKVTPSSKELQ